MEGAQPTAERGDLVDRLFDDRGRRRRVGRQVGRAARRRAGYSLPLTPPSRAVFTLAMPMRACWLRDHVRTELEQGAAAGDREVDRAGEAGRHVERQVERRGVDRQRVAVAPLAAMPLTVATTSVPSSRAPWPIARGERAA